MTKLVFRPLSAAALGLALSALAAAPGCSSGPTRIDPTSDEKVVSMGVDYDEILEWSQKLTQRMLASGFLNNPRYQPYPVTMVVSRVDNNTNLSNFPNGMLLGRIRATLANSGKAQWVTTYGGDGTEEMSFQTDDLQNDPRFEKLDRKQAGEKFKTAQLAVKTEIDYLGARDGRLAQNTYEVRMYVTDVVSGTAVWEGFSDPIAKKSKKGALSF